MRVIRNKKLDLTDFYDSRQVDYREIDMFRNKLDLEGYKVIIGGCCGYGTREMEELIQQVKYLSVKELLDSKLVLMILSNCLQTLESCMTLFHLLCQ